MFFRRLRADEIDCRAQSINAKGLVLLLYKDARVDMNILDETVGAMNWQKSYSRDNANCTVSIWDEVKKQWISKEDTGTESNTEKEKGLASDSFKRACFNWGIGRELYTAPLIWVSEDNCTINTDKGYRCNDNFSVKLIEYDDFGNITNLVIVNDSRRGIEVYRMGARPKAEFKEEHKAAIPTMVAKHHIKTIESELERTGISLEQFLNVMKVKSIESMTIEQFKSAMGMLAKYKDKH